MLEIKEYKNRYKDKWDQFVRSAKNGHFMFVRDYMEYHSDRFKDFSLVILNEKDKILGLLPANIVGNTVWSHQGLSFGGIIIDNKIKIDTYMKIMDLIFSYLKKEKIEKLIIKTIPYIYAKFPSEEHLYAFFHKRAKLVNRDINSVIDLSRPIKFRKGRKANVKRAIREGVEIIASDNFEEFWLILEQNLEEKHGVKPTHTLSELNYLKSVLPNEIKLFNAVKDDKTIAGIVIYEAEEVVHAQYMVNGPVGRNLGALDLILEEVMTSYKKNKKYLSLGVSSEPKTGELNRGLLSQKEGFGARAVAMDIYEIAL